MTQCAQANATTSLTNPKATARHTTTRAAHYLAHASISVSQLLDSHKQDGRNPPLLFPTVSLNAVFNAFSGHWHRDPLFDVLSI